MAFDTDFAKANQKVHPVEEQWHYPIMTKHGYVPDTKEAVGFVRSYMYTNPATARRIRVTTGANADYWEDQNSAACGYWRDLEPHLEKLTSLAK